MQDVKFFREHPEGGRSVQEGNMVLMGGRCTLGAFIQEYMIGTDTLSLIYCAAYLRQ